MGVQIETSPDRKDRSGIRSMAAMRRDVQTKRRQTNFWAKPIARERCDQLFSKFPLKNVSLRNMPAKNSVLGISTVPSA